MIRSIASLVITAGLIYVLNTSFGPIPAIGTFMDPVGGFWANATADHELPAAVQSTHLREGVSVVFDEHLIPHIFATNDHDLLFAQGYVHAALRLWQMEFQTHAAAGRLSEIVGEVTLDIDRGQRRKGLLFGAQNTLNAMPEDQLSLVQSYTDGVNAYINALDPTAYPLEYKLLGYAPEPWTPLKCALLMKYMSDMLNSHERDMENTNFLASYGRELFDKIYPNIDNYQDPVVEKPGQWDFEPLAKEHIAANAMPATAQTAFRLLEKPHPGNGSNNWAVGPERSATGNAILCNDMHLGLNMPSLWFYNQLSSDNIRVMGHSLPGVPMVITGFTDSIAWGFTNAQRDLLDWYKITFEDKQRNAYLLDGEYVPTDKVVEEIKIAGSSAFYDTVVYTIFGPVTYDDSFRPTSEKVGYARRWLDHDPNANLAMFYGMNTARNLKDYHRALDHFESPAQNVVFASTQGDIAHRVQGKYPLKGIEEGRFVLDGTDSRNRWTTYIPPEHNAQWDNPDRGFVASANQHPADSTYPYYISSTSYEAYRNRTINNVLRADSSVSVEDMKALHFNNYSLKAAESLPTLLDFIQSDPELENHEFVQILQQWDYNYDVDSKAATVYSEWWRAFYRSTWDEIAASDTNLPWPTAFTTIRLMKEEPAFAFFDNIETNEKETAREIAIGTLKKVIESNEEIEPWGKHKSSYLRHLSQVRQLGVYDVINGGSGGDVVNALSSNHGPSERIIVELDPAGVKAWGHYPGGQSGNPGSPYYDDFVDDWASGNYLRLPYYTKPNEATNNKHILTLTPY